MRPNVQCSHIHEKHILNHETRQTKTKTCQDIFYVQLQLLRDKASWNKL